LEKLEVYGGNAVLSGQHGGDHIVRNKAQLHEVKAEPTSMFTLILERLTQVLRAY